MLEEASDTKSMFNVRYVKNTLPVNRRVKTKILKILSVSIFIIQFLITMVIDKIETRGMKTFVVTPAPK